VINNFWSSSDDNGPKIKLLNQIKSLIQTVCMEFNSINLAINFSNSANESKENEVKEPDQKKLPERKSKCKLLKY